LVSPARLGEAVKLPSPRKRPWTRSKDPRVKLNRVRTYPERSSTISGAWNSTTGETCADATARRPEPHELRWRTGEGPNRDSTGRAAAQ
jgi:hypothetical protein